MNHSAVSLPPLWQDASHARIARALLLVHSYPGRIEEIGSFCAPADAALGVLACLADQAVSIADPQQLIDAEYWPFLAAARAPVETAPFILVDATQPVPDDFHPSLGESEHPERGASLIARITSLGHGPASFWHGPGIDGTARLACTGLDASWLRARRSWCRHMPLGIDLILADATHIAALPRSSRSQEDR